MTSGERVCSSFLKGVIPSRPASITGRGLLPKLAGKHIMDPWVINKTSKKNVKLSWLVGR